MKPVSRPPRTPSRLPDSLDRQVNLYALAAAGASAHRQLNTCGLAVSVAGVSLLGLAHSAEAKIVYTKTHRVISGAYLHSVYRLNFTRHTAPPDFSLWAREGDNGITYTSLGLTPERSGGGAIGKGPYASALHRGSRIGEDRDFLTANARLAYAGRSWRGPWVNVNNRYLGLKFQIKGRVHYGWARMSVSVGNGQFLKAVLTGYAYETVPNKPITAGQTKSADDERTLGRLALGRK